MSRLQSKHKRYKAYDIHPYSIHRLARVLAERAGSDIEDIKRKNHYHYLEGYFDSPDINAKTIIAENNYIDKDYLSDFSEYYLRCFKHYSKSCTRLHFFNSRITKPHFEAVLRGEIQGAAESLQKSYLGFVVVKPLPETIIGRTCLKVYGSDSGRRQYLGITANNVNLFGINLQIHSLPFQEQDKAVAACATSALWSAFHATGYIFHHPILSPSEITKAASAHAPLDSRYFPNAGLTAYQMAAAIRSVGLEPYKVSARNADVFQATLYAYLKNNIPVIFGFKIVDESKKSKPQVLGKHAVAITGYSMLKKSGSADRGHHLESLNIDKIYVHDDQIGPFARMSLHIDLSQQTDNLILDTSWTSPNGKIKKFKAYPELLLIPLYHKIRIPFTSVYDRIAPISEILNSLDPIYDVYGNGIIWDIYLTTNNDIKTELFNLKSLNDSILEQFLTTGLPRYIWRATANGNGAKIADFLFDATDIEQGAFLAYSIYYDDKFKEIISMLANHPLTKHVFKSLQFPYCE